MSELSTSAIVKQLSKTAHTEENKGHFEKAENLYKAIVTLEEMSHFPSAQVKQAQRDAARAEGKHFDQMIDEAEKSYRNRHNRVLPKDSNDNGIFHSKKPSYDIYDGPSKKKQDFLLIPEPKQLYEV